MTRRFPIACIVSTDEVHRDGSTDFRKYGWALRGVLDEVLTRELLKNTRFSMMVATSIDSVAETLTCAKPLALTALDCAQFLHRFVPHVSLWDPDLPVHQCTESHARSVLLIHDADIHSDGRDNLAH